MGYLNWAPDIHLGSGSARHIEEIRRLTSKAKAFTNESERAVFEAQMLYGVHVFARAKVIPDLALSRGEQAHAHAREMGDRSLEFLAAGGTAMAHLDMGEVAPAKPWLERAAAIASEHPTPLRARRLETLARDGAPPPRETPPGCAQHLERAVQLAADDGPAGRRSARRSARLALEASRLGAELERRRAARARRARGDRSGGARERRSPATRRGEPRPTRRSLGSRSREAGPTKRPITRARRSQRCSRRMHEDRNLDVAMPVANALDRERGAGVGRGSGRTCSSRSR